MKTQHALPANSNINPSHPSHNGSGHADTVEDLRRALAALLAGRPDEARSLIAQRAAVAAKKEPIPIELETAAPEFILAARDAAAAWDLYQEAWKRRQDLLTAFLDRYGASQVSLGGEVFHVVKRERNGSTAVFLRRTKA